VARSHGGDSIREEYPYLTALFGVLGRGESRYADPSAWERLERTLGFGLPEDYKRVVDAFAPADINGHLTLAHPATERFNLGTWIRETSEAWAQVPWDEYRPEGDPRDILGTKELRFGTRDGLLPCASTDRGETLFFAPGAAGARWRIFIDDGEGEFFEYNMSFSQWLYLYVSGEDMVGPDSSAYYPGPIALQRLPMTPGERPPITYGPPPGEPDAPL
jgi:hypothetical protein